MPKAAKTKLCVACGHNDMAFETRDLSFAHKGHSVTVAAIVGWHCPHCGEAYLEDNGRYAEACSAVVQKARAEEVALLRQTRKKLALTQAQAGELFGGGVSAFSEYERGKTQPHKSTVLLMRLLNKHPDLLAEVRT